MRRFSTVLVLMACAACVVCAAGCKGSPDPTPFCSDTPEELPPPATSAPTWWRDVKPILDSACITCHVDGGLAPFRLLTYDDTAWYADMIRESVIERRMPPRLSAPCCATYHGDFALSALEISTIAAWVDAGKLEGDPADEPPPLPQRGGLSRVDLVLAMDEPYSPDPPEGKSDDNRCFVIDWPLDEEAYITGVNVRPGNRAIVHHLVLAVIDPDIVDDVEELDAEDAGYGFDCGGGLGGIDFRAIHPVGASLLGSDFPGGLGRKVVPGSKAILNIHYATSGGDGQDQTAVELKIDASAKPFKTIPLANAAWLVDDAFMIEAGETDAVYWHQFEPTLFSNGDRLWIRGVTPHMHHFGTKFVVRIIRESGERVCLLEIPRWDFGWEQSYWLAEPIALDPGDELYVECHYDNSAANQPYGGEPRDIGWGPENQDMCAAFVKYTKGDEP